jgi:hypothetical protein
LEFFPLYKRKCWFTQGRYFFGGEFSPFGKKIILWGKKKKCQEFPIFKKLPIFFQLDFFSQLPAI